MAFKDCKIEGSLMPVWGSCCRDASLRAWTGQWHLCFYRLHAMLCYAKSLQLCSSLCDPIDGSPPGSPVPGILQARILEWVAISFSSAWKWKWSHSIVSDPQRPHGLQPSRLLCTWDFPGKSTGMGCHCLLRKESWAPKNSCFWTVVLENTLESPLGCKEI